MKRLWSTSLILLALVLTVRVARATTIYEIQYTTDPSGISPYAGPVVTTSGIVTGPFADGYVLAEAPGPWHAVYVYSIRNGPRLGDEVEVTGQVSEYYGMTEIANVTACAVLSTGNAIAPWSVQASSAGQEMHESVLVSLAALTVTVASGAGDWTVEDATGTLRCGHRNDIVYFPEAGDQLDAVTGILVYSGGTFQVEPRNTGDIQGGVIPHYAIRGDIVTMNENLDIIEDACVVIQGDRILAIAAEPPGGTPIVDVDGLIFPGLIDGHNHAVYNVLDLIPFGQIFNDRYEWRVTPVYTQFTAQINGIRDYGSPPYYQDLNIFKVAEARALCAGTTMMQSQNCNGSVYDFVAHQGIGIGNVERFPSRVYDSVFPLDQGQSFWSARANEYWDRFVIHLSEGKNAAALQEFYTWIGWNMLDDRTVILHGIPYGPTEWGLMAAAGAHLVWSPASDWYLYEACPEIPEALAAGVNVAIAPDWTESGRPDMLEEMKFAYALDTAIWGVLTPLDLALFATRNAALAMGIEDRAGQVGEGFQADLMVIPGDPGNPYQALLDAERPDVRLTVVSGRPMYGDLDLLAQFAFVSPVEEIAICGHRKGLGTQIATSYIAGSSKPMANVMAELEVAYANVQPQVCAFLGPYGCSAAAAPEPLAGRTRRLVVRPNPVRGVASLSFSLASEGSAAIRIHDIQGRVRRTLAPGALGPGGHVVLWDGRDDAGARVAQGVYFVRLEAGRNAQTAKILVIR